MSECGDKLRSAGKKKKEKKSKEAKYFANAELEASAVFYLTSRLCVRVCVCAHAYLLVHAYSFARNQRQTALTSPTNHSTTNGVAFLRSIYSPFTSANRSLPIPLRPVLRITNPNPLSHASPESWGFHFP